MLLLAAFFALAAGVFAQTKDALSPDLLLLSKIRARMVRNLLHEPNYTCVETVERARRSSPTGKFEPLDTLRLEVALVDGQEMFGWPGAKSFEDTDLRQMVSTGAFGNGNFANHARAIFEGGFTRFTYKGETTLDETESGLDDRAALRFDYAIPLLGSGYLLRAGERQATVAYHGAIYADPETLDVERIEVEADDIPAALGLAHADDRVNYARVPVGGGDFLLPVESELTMRNSDGSENRNHVRFASCREFAGHAVLTFAEAPVKEAAPISVVELPAETGLMLRLTADLDTQSAAVGDPVRAILENDIKQKGQILFPKGSVAVGRISRLEHHDDSTVVGLEFFELQSAGARATLKLCLEQVPGGEFLNPHPGRLSVPAARPREGIIPLGDGHSRLNRGLLMFWRTTS